MSAIDTKSITQELKKDGARSASVAMRAAKRFSADKCTTLAAGIAFYSAFSLGPRLLMVIAVAGWFYGAEAARGQLFSRVQGFLGSDAAAAIQAIVEHAHQQGGGGFAAILSVVLLIVGASATFSSLNTALDVVLPMPDTGGRSSVVQMVRTRLVSFGLVLGVAFLLIVSLVLDTAITFIGTMLWQNTPFVFFGNLVQMVVSFVIMLAAFGALIKFLPDSSASVHWRDAAWGGAVSALLFTIGKKLFAMYLAHAGTASAFGAAGSLAVLLMWLYFSAAVLLLGAEIAAVRGNFPPSGLASAMKKTRDEEEATPVNGGAVAAPRQALSRVLQLGKPAHPSAGAMSVDTSKAPTSAPASRASSSWMRLAAQAAPLLLHGATLLFPLRREKQPAAVVAPPPAPKRHPGRASRAIGAAALVSLFKRKPPPAKRGITRVTGVGTPYGRAVARRNRHSVASALFAAGTGLAIAALANRQKK